MQEMVWAGRRWNSGCGRSSQSAGASGARTGSSCQRSPSWKPLSRHMPRHCSTASVTALCTPCHTGLNQSGCVAVLQYHVSVYHHLVLICVRPDMTAFQGIQHFHDRVQERVQVCGSCRSAWRQFNPGTRTSVHSKGGHADHSMHNNMTADFSDTHAARQPVCISFGSMGSMGLLGSATRLLQLLLLALKTAKQRAIILTGTALSDLLFVDAS